MPIFKGTMIFTGPQHGWTESWWVNWANDDYAAVMSDLTGIALRRKALLGNQNDIIGLRVSKEGLKNDGYSQFVQLVTATATPSCDSDEPDACVVAHAYDANSQRKKAIFLRGIPDAIDIQFGKLVTDPCGWGDAFKEYSNRLKLNRWGWMGRPAAGPLKRNMTGYVLQSDGRIQMSFDAPLFVGVDNGSKQVVTVSGVNAPQKSVLTGQIVVTVDGGAVCTTYNPIAAFPYTNGGHGLFAVPEFIEARFFNLSRIGTRRVGAPLLVSRGRRRARAKG